MASETAGNTGEAAMKCARCRKDADRMQGLHICDDCWRCDDCDSRESLCSYVDGLRCDGCQKAHVQRQIDAFDPRDADHSSDLLCPWCGYSFSEPWEYTDGEQECHNCERTFDLSTETVRYYTTNRIEAAASR